MTPLIRNLSLVALLTAVLVICPAASAQDAAVEEEGCVLKDTECTCGQSTSVGECTRMTESGKCLQGDCTPSHKCDCLGYELCAIQTCGMWAPSVSAIMSRTDEFQCQYEAVGSQCRMAADVAETMDAADNANAASEKYLEDIVEDEVDIVAEVQEALTLKVKSLSALRDVQSRMDAIDAEEVEEVSELAKTCAVEFEMIVKELGEATADATAAFDAMEKARRARRRARRNEDKAKDGEREEKKASAEAKEKNIPCKDCDEMKAKTKALRTERKRDAKEAGTWAKKGRDAKHLGKTKKASVKNRKEKVQLTSGQCVAKSQKILDRLGKQ